MGRRGSGGRFGSGAFDDGHPQADACRSKYCPSFGDAYRTLKRAQEFQLTTDRLSVGAAGPVFAQEQGGFRARSDSAKVPHMGAKLDRLLPKAIVHHDSPVLKPNCSQPVPHRQTATPFLPPPSASLPRKGAMVLAQTTVGQATMAAHGPRSAGLRDKRPAISPSGHRSPSPASDAFPPALRKSQTRQVEKHGGQCCRTIKGPNTSMDQPGNRKLLEMPRHNAPASAPRRSGEPAHRLGVRLGELCHGRENLEQCC